MDVLYIVFIVIATIVATILWVWVIRRREASLDIVTGKIKMAGWIAILIMAVCCVIAAVGIIGLMTPDWREIASVMSVS